ncbi:hypothetical protein GCM10010372_47750 [Streptomyces tauricus]|uniref:DUF4097 domain-containing protein n=1 Tax=Streptomyces tauricus TaxID=68274 RepID=A0ABZ1JAF3_9ACTN|nr:DUF4097 family beta strand repeat-containing protein [Streptomyces tauricus]GHA42197.1 hypothetical protein GCM10010372_47750 [Streptomyces tauricus]
MPSFDTPEPIAVAFRVDAGTVRLIASERSDTVVDVLARDPEKNADIKAVDQTRVTYAGGTLTVAAPKTRYPLGRTGSVDVVVELPAGSRVEVDGSWTEVRGEGRLGEVRVKTSSGDVHLDVTGPLQLTASHGSVTVGHVQGLAEITTSSGSLRVGTVDGNAVLKNSHGATTVGAVVGELRVKGAHGDILVERAESSVIAANAHGTLRVADVARGTVQLETSYGGIEVGIRAGTAAWLDVSSEKGRVHNALTVADGPDPEESGDSVEVRARTRWGNIEVRRARA